MSSQRLSWDDWQAMIKAVLRAGFRSQQRVDASCKRVREAAAGGWVKGFTYDLSCMQSVQGFAAAVRQDVPTLNVLLNNAGQPWRQVSCDIRSIAL